MKLVEAMYGWNQNSDEIDVGPWPDTTGWSDRYSLTGGACYTNIRQMAPDQLAAQIFIPEPRVSSVAGGHHSMKVRSNRSERL